MPNFGLMSGNPYYSGPSGLAAGVNALADNLMKAYGTFSGVNQKQQELEMQKKLMQIKLDEETNKVKAREAMAGYDRGLMSPISVPGKSVEFQPQAVPEELQGVSPGAMIDIPSGQYTNQMDAWKAQGKNPEAEYLKGAYSMLAKFYPEKALALREKLYSATNTTELREALLSFKKATAEAELGLKEQKLNLQKELLDWRDKNSDANRQNAVLIAGMRAASRGGSQPKEDDGSKEQIKANRAQNMALRDLKTRYTYDSMTGAYMDDAGRPVPRSKITSEYNRLVQQYRGGAGGTARTNSSDPLGIR